jgi:hypothetical protein
MCLARDAVTAWILRALADNLLVGQIECVLLGEQLVNQAQADVCRV